MYKEFAPDEDPMGGRKYFYFVKMQPDDRDWHTFNKFKTYDDALSFFNHGKIWFRGELFLYRGWLQNMGSGVTLRLIAHVCGPTDPRHKKVATFPHP